MTAILTDISQITPDWLTAALRRAHLLTNENVTHISLTGSRQTNVSFVGYLSVLYDRPATAPQRFFLKIPNADFAWGNHEVDFYTRIVPIMRKRWSWDELPFPACYDSAYDPNTGRSHLLFADASATHFGLVDEMMPAQTAHQQQVVDAFARLHAFWWEHPLLGQDIGQRITAVDLVEWLPRAQTCADDFIAFMSDRLSQMQQEVLTAVTADWPPRRKERIVTGQGITLIHRDPHPLNFLYPHDPAVQHTMLIDWQSWRVDTGTDDLAYTIACHWPDAARADMEQTLLQRYHRRLCEFGVTNYSWDDCWYDYRASIARCLFFLIAAWKPVQWQRGWWWPKLAQGMAAFVQLRGFDLWSI